MASVMFDSDDPAALAHPLCAGARVATYADLLTPAIVEQFTGRLVVIDRGQGDPLNLAHVADIESALMSPATGAAKIRQWSGEGRPYITAYHDRAQWAVVDAVLGDLHPWNWVATLDGTANPAGKWPAVVQIADETKLGFHADLSIVWNELWCPLPAGVLPAQLAALKKLAAHVAPGFEQVIQALEAF